MTFNYRGPLTWGLVLASVTASPASERWTDNLGLRREIMAQASAGDHGAAASRLALGGEVQKKFSSPTSTWGSLDVQIRLVRRDRYIPVQNDMEGMDRHGWWLEYHNAYLDLYNILNPFVSETAQNRLLGRIHWRAGRFYVPFGLNLQTDTHGSLLQLSNEENFGFERDWHTGFWGQLNEHLNYDLHYLLGSGYHPRFDGQTGMGAFRLSLSPRYAYEQNIEGGVSTLGGERLDEMGMIVKTWRSGMDGRYRSPIPTGLLTGTAEWSGGRDDTTPVISQLYQGEYLHQSRRWGLGTQYRRFWRDGPGTEASLIGEVTWYWRNDVASSNLHWLKWNVEKKVASASQPKPWTWTLQYYRYW